MTKPSNAGVSCVPGVHTRCVFVPCSHLKATLLDVVELQTKRLYAAYDSPLVANQTDPDAPDVAEGQKEDVCW